ncbi:Adenosylcobinamide-GDP ribazoletransferase [Petrocella atlantisensis]|uniref:Adenosylcobinamide-GDP ribazoletransferase n=1 Tax=Petrocella atlantisensis TaxID=2173034 RepID=A0A3P7P8N5_9FIRM|nr:adenosylcobinamide-GDP ribazoletransferase [Petrocella atlantisensis]VDN46563.1 Adenosylcobinamide-GDP ribazoletransferase [Petrocella atlantisensis]
MKSFIMMLTYITRIPFPIKLEYDEKTFVKGLYAMPIIGLFIGMVMAGAMWIMKDQMPQVKAFVMILIYLAMVGGLHLDGLADYIDGIFSGRTKDRILEIMSDSRIGSFGVIGLCLYFIGMYTGLQYSSWQVVLLAPVVARVMAIWVIGFGTYAKKDGMGKGLIDYGRPWHGLCMLMILTAVVFIWQPILIKYVFMILFGTVLLLRWTTKQMGGITGDVIGAVIESTQVFWLLSIVLIGG